MTGNSNFELEKTLTISFSIFSIVDISDAIINNESTIDKLLSINYAGLIKLGKELCDQEKEQFIANMNFMLEDVWDECKKETK